MTYDRIAALLGILGLVLLIGFEIIRRQYQRKEAKKLREDFTDPAFGDERRLFAASDSLLMSGAAALSWLIIGVLFVRRRREIKTEENRLLNNIASYRKELQEGEKTT